MGYAISVGETRPLLDATGSPLATAGVTSPDGHGGPFGVGLAATIKDDGHGALICVGNSAGTVTFELHKSGAGASHTVTVSSSFDWTLGDPA